MHENRFHGDISRLRRPERLAWLEVARVVSLCLQDGEIQRVLDVGTGSGIFAEAFAKAGLKVEGVDANPEMVATAQLLVPGLRFEVSIAEALPYPRESFDLVFLGLVLHETDDHLKAMRAAAGVTRKRVAVLEWPYRHSEPGPDLSIRVSKNQILELATGAGLKVKRVLPLQTLVLYLLERKKNANFHQN